MVNVIKTSAKRWTLKRNTVTHAGEYVIDWAGMQFGSKGTKHQKEYLRQSAKEFYEAQLSASEKKYGELSSLTLQGWFIGLRQLTTWMTKNGIWRFSALCEEDIVAYVRERQRNGKGKTGAVTSTLDRIVSVFRSMWDLRMDYTAPLRVNPYRISELGDILRNATPNGWWQPIPDEMALELILDAMEWCGNVAPTLIKVLADLNTLYARKLGPKRKNIKARAKDAYAAISETEVFKALPVELRNCGEPVHRILYLAIRLTLGAAIVLILFLSGIRIGELVFLQRKAISRERHLDGHYYRYMHGIAAKKKGARRRWIIPDPVAQAISMVEELTGTVAPPLRNAGGFLLVSFSGNSALAHRERRISKMAPGVATKMMQCFARSELRRNPFPKSRRFHSHQARKTFANFVVRRDKRSLEALAQHYGHLYTAVLDGAYIGSDRSLKSLLEEESLRDLTAGLTDILTSKSLGGKAGLAVGPHRDKILAAGRFRGKRAIKKVVDDLIKKGVTLAPCDWGYCVYAQDVSACRGDETGPNPVNRNPGTCSTCQNFAVTEKHRQWWSDRFSREENFLRQPHLPEQTRRVVEIRLAETSDVLRTMNEWSGTDGGKKENGSIPSKK